MQLVIFVMETIIQTTTTAQDCTPSLFSDFLVIDDDGNALYVCGSGGDAGKKPLQFDS